MVILVQYQPVWQQAFTTEAANIRARLGSRALRIDHVGSTSVPGLAARPVIDIQVSLASLEPREILVEELAELGYVHVHLGAFDVVYPFFTRPGIWPCTHHVHLCIAGSEEERNHLAFRDYLRANASIAAEYERLKADLAASHDGTTLESQEKYSLSKSEFVSSVVARALQRGLPVRGPSDA
jgi:GrpB-like predicted nucleotidyltransferase (UPF0157 family)